MSTSVYRPVGINALLVNCVTMACFPLTFQMAQVTGAHMLSSACCRCVETFDHHCPAINNCVGQGNQRSFAGWLGLLFTAQLLFLHLSCAFCSRVARHRWATAGIHDRTGWTAIGPGLWVVLGMHPGMMLLILLEVCRHALTSKCMWLLWHSVKVILAES